jgi:hypothetical protein
VNKKRLLGMTVTQFLIIIILAFLCFAVISYGIFIFNGFNRSETSSTSKVPTTVPEAPKSDNNTYIVGIWKDEWLLPCTITIKSINGTYTMTRLFDDGSESTEVLSVQIVNGVEVLIEDPNSPAGDYMVILENGNLAFYDNEGFIYEDYPSE